MRIIDNRSAIRDQWRSFIWPDWVPAAVRVQVEHIWSSPAEWHRNSAAVSALKLGTSARVMIDAVPVVGQYIHVRNTIGRIVDEHGRVHVVELADGRPRARRAS